MIRDEIKSRTNDILDIIKDSAQLFIYGIGGVSCKLYEILKQYGIKPNGFIVSDGYKVKNDIENIHIFELSEIESKLTDACVLLAVHNSANIIENMEKVTVKHFRVIDDVKDICALFAVKTIEYLEKKGVNLSKEYIQIKDYISLNPLYTDWEYCLAWVLESGDLLCPCLLNDFNRLDEGSYEYGNVVVEQKEIVIDCGANIGLFSSYAAYKGAKVYAFEPVPAVAEWITKTSIKYENNVFVEPYALSSSAGTVEFYIQSGNLTSGSMDAISQNTKDLKIIVEVKTIDDWVKENNISKVDFIKADIEGAEREMLKGAEKTIKRDLPKISICTYHLKDDPEVLENIIRGFSDRYVIEHKWKKMFAYVPQ